jgi:hypothetical protein
VHSHHRAGAQVQPRRGSVTLIDRLVTTRFPSVDNPVVTADTFSEIATKSVRCDEARFGALVQDGGMLADVAPDPEPAETVVTFGLVGLVCLVLVAAIVTVVVLVLRRRR